MTTIRIASPVDLTRVRDAYRAWGYDGGVAESDRVYVAESSGELIGLVRRTEEHAVTMLRGMQVSPTHQRQGVGSRLLQEFTKDLGSTECFCVPYAHLTAFYGKEGFAPISDAAAPLFLQQRLIGYRAQGLDVLVMHRR